MKILARLLVPVLLIGFASCSSDDEPSGPPTKEERISGRWTLVDLTANGTITFMGNSIPFVSTNSDIDPGSYFNFSRNPQEVDYDASATITISAVQEFDIPYQRAGQGTWEFKGNDSLIVSENGQTTRYFILGWTDTRMILRSKQDITLAGQSANTTIEAVIER